MHYYLGLIIVSLLLTQSIGVPLLPTENVETDPELIGNFFQGDMVLETKYNGIKDHTKRWPNGVVFYKIGTMYDVDHVLEIMKAMQLIESKTCIRFRPALDITKAFVEIADKAKGCHSNIGYNRVKQTLNLHADPIGDGCFQIGKILHELMHTLGFYHQHSVFDRDNFIEVLKENIIDGMESSFSKLDSGVATSFGVPYDYGSIMHYSPKAYSKNGKDTIVPLKSTTAVLGQRLNLSDGDVQKLNMMYDCS